MNTYITFGVKVAWWVIPYIYIIRFCCFLTRVNIDANVIVSFLINNGIKIEVKGTEYK